MVGKPRTEEDPEGKSEEQDPTDQDEREVGIDTR